MASRWPIQKRERYLCTDYRRDVLKGDSNQATVLVKSKFKQKWHQTLELASHREE